MHEFSPFYFMISINTHFGGSSRVVFDENLSFSPHKICLLSLERWWALLSLVENLFSSLCCYFLFFFVSFSYQKNERISLETFPTSFFIIKRPQFQYVFMIFYVSLLLPFYFIFIAAFVVSSFFMIHLTASRKQHWMSIKKTERKAFHFLKLLFLQLSILYDFLFFSLPAKGCQISWIFIFSWN